MRAETPSLRAPLFGERFSAEFDFDKIVGVVPAGSNHRQVSHELPGTEAERSRCYGGSAKSRASGVLTATFEDRRAGTEPY